MAKPNPEAQLAVKLREEWDRNNSHGSARAGSNICIDAARLMSIARSLRRLYTSVLNDNLQGLQRANRAARINNTEKAAAKIITEYGLDAIFNDDPRGYESEIWIWEVASDVVPT